MSGIQLLSLVPMMKYFIVAALLCLADARPRVDTPEQRPVATFDIEPTIIGGSNVDITAHPHQVSLYYTSGSHTCGSSILSNTKLVCAAHCTQNPPSQYSIRAGSSDRTSGGQTRTVSSIINHPNYSGSAPGFPNDVSTIRIATDLVFGSGVGSISLASSGDFAGQTATITGWGRTSSSNVLPNMLQGVNIPVISNSDCTSRMSGVGGAAINAGHICVYSGSVGACNGDSGGPMRVGSVLTGITSWVVSSGGTCLTSYPSVYTRVTYFNSWIGSN